MDRQLIKPHNHLDDCNFGIITYAGHDSILYIDKYNDLDGVALGRIDFEGLLEPQKGEQWGIFKYKMRNTHRHNCNGKDIGIYDIVIGVVTADPTKLKNIYCYDSTILELLGTSITKPVLRFVNDDEEVYWRLQTSGNNSFVQGAIGHSNIQYRRDLDLNSDLDNVPTTIANIEAINRIGEVLFNQLGDSLATRTTEYVNKTIKEYINYGKRSNYGTYSFVVSNSFAETRFSVPVISDWPLQLIELLAKTNNSDNEHSIIKIHRTDGSIDKTLIDASTIDIGNIQLVKNDYGFYRLYLQEELNKKEHGTKLPAVNYPNGFKIKIPPAETVELDRMYNFLFDTLGSTWASKTGHYIYGTEGVSKFQDGYLYCFKRNLEHTHYTLSADAVWCHSWNNQDCTLWPEYSVDGVLIK
jgi:hypothetical protein